MKINLYDTEVYGKATGQLKSRCEDSYGRVFVLCLRNTLDQPFAKAQQHNLELTDKNLFVELSLSNPWSRALKCDLGTTGTIGSPHQPTTWHHR